MLKVRLQPGLRKLEQPPCPSAGTSSLYAVVCLPAVKTSCKVSHYLRRLTREAGPDRGAHRCPQSRRGPQTSPPGGPHAGPGPPGCGTTRLSGPLPSAAGGRAEGPRRGPWPGPQPHGKEASRQTAAFSRQPAGGAEICQVHVQENKSGDAEDAWRGRRSGSRCGAGRSSAVWSSRPERGLAGNQGLFGPGLGPRLASRPRQGQSGKHRDSNTHPPSTSGSGTARGPRLPNGRNGTTKKDWR